MKTSRLMDMITQTLIPLTRVSSPDDVAQAVAYAMGAQCARQADPVGAFNAFTDMMREALVGELKAGAVGDTFAAQLERREHLEG